MDYIFILLFLAVFPFGQIFHLGFNLLGIGIAPQPIDIVVVVSALYAILAKYKKPEIFKYFTNFMLVTLFSFALSIFIFKTSILIYGFLYLVRLFAYFYFLIYVWNFVKKKSVNKKLLLDSLLGVSLISTLFGWIQFFAIPDIKPLFIFNWDMHLFRLVGTFLDPSFLGLIIVFGLILSIHRCIVSRNWKNVLITFFLLISLAFTYSRASYLAFLIGGVALAIFEKKIKYILYIFAVLIFLVAILPTSRNHSIEFFRSFSVIDRIDNYSQTLQIIKKFPVFGVGFDNLCFARNKYVGVESFFSHSCSGSDSSLLFILATTGIIGFMVFISTLCKIAVSIKPTSNSSILISCFFALLVHSLFSNSPFYPWIMGYLIILIAVSLME